MFADSLTTVLSPVLNEVPADGVLRTQLDPLAQDGWVEGPVRCFVDLVVVPQQADDLHFTVVSNTLTALVDIAAAGPAQRDDVAAAAVRWLGSVFVGGADSRLVTSVQQSLDEIVGAATTSNVVARRIHHHRHRVLRD